MTLLSEIWNEWASPDAIQKAGKKVGITSVGLNVEWMDKAKFERAEAILNPGTPQKAQSSSTVDSPVHLLKGTLEYHKYKYEQTKERIDELEKPLSQ